MTEGREQDLTVIKFGGSSLTDLDALVRFLKESGPTVVVHGGGPEIQKQLDLLGMPSEFREGLRVTPRETMDVVEMVLAGRVNKRVVAHLRKAGFPAVGLSGIDGGTLPASLYRQGEWGQVGQETHVESQLLTTLLAAGFLPVLSPVGFLQDSFEPLNINADTAAAAVAAALRAARFIFCTDVPGLRDGEGQTLKQVTPTGISQLVGSGVISGGMIPKMEAALSALEHGVNEVVIRSLASQSPGTVLKKEGYDVVTF